MPTLDDYLRAIGSGFGSGVSSALSPSRVQSFLSDPQLLAGGGLLLGGALSDREPGEVLEARQYLRNLFTSPSAISQDVAGQVGALGQYYEPLLRQQEKALLDEVQQRASMGIPRSVPVAIGGGELAELRDAAESRLLPRRYALMGELGLGALGTRTQAARDILSTSRPDPTASAIANLGTMLMADRFSQRGQGAIGLPGAGVGGMGSGGLGGAPGSGLGGGGDPTLMAITALLGGQAIGGFGRQQGAATEILDQQGRIIGWIDAQGNVASVQGGVRGNVRQAGALGGSGFGSLGAGIGGASVGIPAGIGIGSRLAEPGSSAPAIGAGTGAVLGGVIGSAFGPPGAAVGAALGGAAGGAVGGAAKSPDLSSRETVQGALGGTFGGAGTFFAAQGDGSTGDAMRDAAIVAGATAIFGPAGGITAGAILGKQRGAALEKAKFRREDLDSQADQVQEIGQFFSDELRTLGQALDPGELASFETFISEQIAASPAGPTSFSVLGVSGTDDQQQNVARVGGALLLRSYQRVDPSIRSLNQVPGLRAKFLDALTRSTFSSGDSSYGGGAPLNQFPGWAGVAGLARGGLLRRGQVGLVGESGPELVAMAPEGAMVVPLGGGRG